MCREGTASTEVCVWVCVGGGCECVGVGGWVCGGILWLTLAWFASHRVRDEIRMTIAAYQTLYESRYAVSFACASARLTYMYW